MAGKKKTDSGQVGDWLICPTCGWAVEKNEKGAGFGVFIFDDDDDRNGHYCTKCIVVKILEMCDIPKLEKVNMIKGSDVAH